MKTITSAELEEIETRVDAEEAEREFQKKLKTLPPNKKPKIIGGHYLVIKDERFIDTETRRTSGLLITKDLKVGFEARMNRMKPKPTGERERLRRLKQMERNK